MRRYIIILSALLLGSIPSLAQQTNQKIKVFYDCNGPGCDFTYIRSEINMVDFLLDRVASDLHLLITSNQSGSGGRRFQAIFYGQGRFANMRDTLFIQTDPNATSFEVRDEVVHFLKLGLTPYIAKTDVAKDVSISLKSVESSSNTSPVTPSKDKWDYWVFNVGANGFINVNQVRTNGNYGGNFSASRVTDELKVNVQAGAGTNFRKFTISQTDDDGNKYDSIVLVENSNFNFNHQLVKSVNSHWSYGYTSSLIGDSFSNYKSRLTFRPALEYNFYPYSEVNTRFFAINYGIEYRNNHYYDSTLYFKTSETVFQQSVLISTSVNQKWGSFGVGLRYRSYLHNFELKNFAMNLRADLRVTGGLSIFINLNGSIVHDQIYLKKESGSAADVLLQQQQIASSFNYNSNVGLNLRFGTKLNNYVNQRFTGRALNFDED